jgi:hypothetical protein
MLISSKIRNDVGTEADDVLQMASTGTRHEQEKVTSARALGRFDLRTAREFSQHQEGADQLGVLPFCMEPQQFSNEGSWLRSCARGEMNTSYSSVAHGRKKPTLQQF